MAEGLVNYTRLDDPEDVVVTTQGRPISPDDEMRVVVDDDGARVAPGEVGHLLTRGPYTIRGYYRAPEHNATRLHRRRLLPHRRPGPARRPSGYLVVEGRAKDQINRGGEKIAAEEVENHLLAHPAVARRGRGRPCPTRSSASAPARSSSRVRDRSRRAAAALAAFLRERGLAAYKVPDRVEFVDAFPQTGVGKVSKKALREPRWPTTRAARHPEPPTPRGDPSMALPAIAPYAHARRRELPANRVGLDARPRAAVLLVHDMQRYFLAAFSPDRVAGDAAASRNIPRCASTAPALGIPVVYTAQPGEQTPEQRGLQRDFWGRGMAAARRRRGGDRRRAGARATATSC